MLVDLVYAMSPSAGGSEGGAGGSLMSLAPFILMFVIFYFILIRPQQKKAKEMRNMLSNLRKGDKVMTSGGLFGEITGITDSVVTIEIAPKIRVKVARAHVAGLASPGQSAPEPAATEKQA